MKYLTLLLILIPTYAFAQDVDPPPNLAVRAANTKAALNARQEYLDTHPRDPDRGGDHKGRVACVKTDGSYDVFLSNGLTCPKGSE